MVGKAYLVKFVVIRVVLFLTLGHLHRGNVCSACGQMGEGRELSLCLLCLSCLRLKIILMLKWHILRRHILTPFRGVGWGGRCFAMLDRVLRKAHGAK